MLSPCPIPNGIMPQNGVVLNPYAVKYTDAAPPTLGQNGEQIISLKGGKYATAALRGQVFCSTSVNSIRVFSNVTQTFGLLNPAGSGVNVELVRCDCCTVLAAVVVNGLGIYYHTSAQVAGWSALSTRPILNAILGGASGKAIAYSAITPAVNPKLQAIVGGWGAITYNGAGILRYDFDGTVVVPPGIGIFVCTTTANATVAGNTLVLTWMEYAA